MASERCILFVHDVRAMCTCISRGPHHNELRTQLHRDCARRFSSLDADVAREQEHGRREENGARAYLHRSPWRERRACLPSPLFLKRTARVPTFTALPEENGARAYLHRSPWRERRACLPSPLFLKRTARVPTFTALPEENGARAYLDHSSWSRGSWVFSPGTWRERRRRWCRPTRPSRTWPTQRLHDERLVAGGQGGGASHRLRTVLRGTIHKVHRFCWPLNRLNAAITNENDVFVTRSIEMGIKSKNWILSYWCYLTDSQKAFPMVPESTLYLQ